MKIKSKMTLACLAAGFALAGSAAMSQAAITVGVDTTQINHGFMNVFELPANGGAYVFGSGWGVPDLNATLTASTITLSPNTSLDRDVPADGFWFQNGGTGAGNKNMYASLYAESDAIAGELVTFRGLVQSLTFAAPYATSVFIRDFVGDYSSNQSITVPINATGVFEVSFQTAPGHHIQYGFETVGPNARISAAAALGSMVITAAPVVPEPTGVALLAGGAAAAGMRRRRA